MGLDGVLSPRESVPSRQTVTKVSVQPRVCLKPPARGRPAPLTPAQLRTRRLPSAGGAAGGRQWVPRAPPAPAVRPHLPPTPPAPEPPSSRSAVPSAAPPRTRLPPPRLPTQLAAPAAAPRAPLRPCRSSGGLSLLAATGGHG